MKTATARDLRNNFARLSLRVENGETVRITKSGAAFAVLMPDRPKRQPAWPDLTARRRRLWPRGLHGRPPSALVDEGRGER